MKHSLSSGLYGLAYGKRGYIEIELFRLDIDMSRNAICSSFSCSIVNLKCTCHYYHIFPKNCQK